MHATQPSDDPPHHHNHYRMSTIKGSAALTQLAGPALHQQPPTHNTVPYHCNTFRALYTSHKKPTTAGARRAAGAVRLKFISKKAPQCTRQQQQRSPRWAVGARSAPAVEASMAC